jgi:ABC-type glycerol-3-phosphate transport system substrate-binding protein
MSSFQITLIGIFIFFILAGALTFSTFGGIGGGNSGYPVLVWGTIPQLTFDEIIKENDVVARYEEKEAATFEQDFVEALASGTGPDVVLLPEELILKHRGKIFTIPYSSYSERTFKDNFIEEGELYLTPEGSIGLPYVVDPMVLYWNRDIFASEAISAPPKYWGELYNIIGKLTKKNESSNILRSGLAFGEFVNVDNAKDILTTLILQTGNPLVRFDDKNVPKSVLSERGNEVVSPAEAALDFYTGFSDPLKTQYSWNRSLPSSREYFLAGDLAMYLGFASEFSGLREKNPNLNFDVSLMPQSKDSRAFATYANMWALAIVNNSTHKNDAVAALGKLTSKDAILFTSQSLKLPPVRRDLLAENAPDSVMSVFYQAAIQSKGWLDPNTTLTTPLFKDMIESVTSGRSRTSEVVTSTSRQLGEILRNYE